MKTQGEPWSAQATVTRTTMRNEVRYGLAALRVDYDLTAPAGRRSAAGGIRGTDRRNRRNRAAHRLPPDAGLALHAGRLPHGTAPVAERRRRLADAAHQCRRRRCRLCGQRSLRGPGGPAARGRVLPERHHRHPCIGRPAACSSTRLRRALIKMPPTPPLP